MYPIAEFLLLMFGKNTSLVGGEKQTKSDDIYIFISIFLSSRSSPSEKATPQHPPMTENLNQSKSLQNQKVCKLLLTYKKTIKVNACADC